MTSTATHSRPAADEQAPLTSGGRIEWVNYAKGIGIVLVVVGHVWEALAAQGVGTLSQQRVMTVVDTAIYQFHMPLFFLLSGLFVARSAQRPFAGFVVQKLKTIAYPYVVWTIIQAAIASRAGGAARTSVSFWSVIKQIPTHPYQEFWFLYVLLMCMIVFGVLWKLRLGSVAILIVAVEFYATRSMIPGMSWGPLYQFSGNFVYFAAGAALAPVVMGGITRIAAPLLLLAALTQWTIVGLLAARAPGLKLMNDVTLTAAMGIAASCAAAAVLSRTPGSRLLAYLGEKSLSIYVAHVVFAAGARVALSKLHVNDLPAQLAIGTLAGLAFPILLDWTSRRVGFRYLFTL